MMRSISACRAPLFLTTAVGVALYAGTAAAQADGAPARADLGQLEEVVVTATRQAGTVNRVPLAVTAQTQRAIDQQGVRTVRDLENLVPSLNTTQSLASGASQFSIRGIGFLGNGQAGAAPVGFYLDDSPLQKRNVGGGVATANGTPMPPLFDLERVEVLRGPQGTLFGGGSEGGTIRYIQPAPSLTRYSEYARVQFSIPKKGDNSYEGGVAVGGPIVKDKLGFRASVFARKIGGFVDLIDPLTKKEWAHNLGGEQQVRMMRGALTWAPTPNMRITADFFSSVDKSKHIGTSYNLDLPNPVVVPTLCFNTNNTPLGQSGFDATGLGVNSFRRGGSVTNLPSAPAPQARINPFPVGRGDAACNQLRAAGDVTHTLPGFTYGPYDLDRYDSILVTPTPSKTNLQIGSLSMQYDFPTMTVKSITTYIDDQTKEVAQQTSPGSPQGGYRSSAAYVDPQFGLRLQPRGPYFNPNFGPVGRGFTGYFISDNKRYGVTQEIRFSSTGGDAARLSWVAGAFYSNIRGKAGYDNPHPFTTASLILYGLTPLQRYGVRGVEGPPGQFESLEKKRQTLKDVEIAAFAEANYWIIPDKLKVTAGIRVSRVSFDYNQTSIGPVSSIGPENTGISTTGVRFNAPTPQNGGTNAGSTAESPVTPKFGLQYQVSDNKMIYVTAAKGFRAGGVNSLVSYGICQTALDAIGYLPPDLPTEYKSDSVWSYELGAKFRLLQNRVQVNAAAYRIDWSNPQYTTNPGSCGLVTTFNVPGARSEGVELELTARVFRGLTLNGAAGYNKSRYTDGLIFPAGRAILENNFNPAPFTVVLKDQKIPVPPYTFNVGGRYEFNVGSKALAYVRGDYRYAADFAVSPFPTTAYTPDSFNQVVETANARIGVEYAGLDINLFVNNLLDRKRGQIGGGRTQCQAAATGGTAACTTFADYNPLKTINTGYPREIGIQIAFRH